MASEYYVGIDVGTGSARAGIFDAKGRCAGVGVEPIRMWRPQPDFVEQSSDNIWKSICKAVRQAMRQGSLKPSDIKGIAFDATCSLVAIDEKNQPVTVSPTGHDDQNIIVWMDHRAIPEAQEITKRGHAVLRYLGGVVSPEHQIPKLTWLRKNMPKSFERTAKFMDLADWLAYRSTGEDVRSLCTTVCKWTYLGHEKKPDDRWNKDLFKQLGLTDLLKKEKIGTRVEPMGNPVGKLQPAPAKELGLGAGTPVAVGIIDAHAGGLGVLGIGASSSKTDAFDDVLALIGGTSSCHMAVSRKARFVKGVWGPYFSAMIPSLWLNEGGQSSTGSLLDFVIKTHPHYPAAEKEAKSRKLTIYELLNERVNQLADEEKISFRAKLTQRIHMLPYFHGNRSPNADPSARGAITGLKLSATMDDLARLYYATIQAVAYGTRDIIQALNAKGYKITRINACGGGTKNPLWIQEHADATGCELQLPREPEAVLLGTAILAAVGAGRFDSIGSAMKAMSAGGQLVKPDKKTAAYHAAKYAIFRDMYARQKAYDEAMRKL